MKYRNTYITCINRNCSSSGNNGKNLAFWRDNLFAGIISYLLPFCLIALLPGIYLSLITAKYVLAAVDILTVVALAALAFMPGISVAVRKIIFACCLYTLSSVLLYYLGLYGPGLVYLLASCIFSILIFQTPYTFWPAWLNTFICLLFAAAVLFDLIPGAHHDGHSAGEWVAVSSNLVFLSFLSAALIPRLFNGLQETIEKEMKIKEELNSQQELLKEALILLQQNNNDLEQFAYVASHDLKEPVRMVAGFMRLLKNKYGEQLDEKANSYIDFAMDGGKRMQRMIDDLLELSRTTRNDNAKESINLGDILNEAKQNIFMLIETSGARIISKTELPFLIVYRSDIVRLLQNLLGNAIKFRRKEIAPVICLHAEEREDKWLIGIEDNGIGIEQEKFEKIFEIFARLHSLDSYDGSGIGLAVCKKVVEHHGGKIWVESEEGKGSNFYFTIKK